MSDENRTAMINGTYDRGYDAGRASRNKEVADISADLAALRARCERAEKALSAAREVASVAMMQRNAADEARPEEKEPGGGEP